MRNNFDDLVRERCKDLLLKGHLARVIAAQQFMGHTDQQFGEFLAPLIQKETVTETPQEITSEEPQHDSFPQSTRIGTVHLKPGYYAVCDETGAELFTGSIGEYRACDYHHGQLVEFRTDSHEIINQNLGDDPSAPVLRYIKHGIVELEPDSQELYVERDINGQGIRELGCAFNTFYLRHMADRFNIHAGDTVDLYVKEDGYPYINWVYRGYDSETTVQNTSTVRKRTKKERESRSSIDYDLTGKKVAIYGIPPRMIQEIENTLIKEKGADFVEVQQLGTYSAGYKVGKAKMLDNTDLVIIVKTGISHSMSYDIVNVCKENNIPFAYTNQPSLKRIEMAIYRALNGYPSDEISAGDLQYPKFRGRKRMKHLFKGLLLFLSLISLTACTTPIKEGHIVDKHMTESHKEMNAYMMGGDMPIFSEDTKPAKYYFDVYGEDENGNGHTVTVQVDEETYNHQKIGDWYPI